MQQQVSCYMIYFDREKLTIKIPTTKVEKFGIRQLVSKEKMNEVFSILRSGVKKMKGMWSRRAQEYETKINSGDIFLLAEVLRDLNKIYGLDAPQKLDVMSNGQPIAININLNNE